MAGTIVTLQPPPQYDVVPPVPVIEQVLSREAVQKFCLHRYPGIKLAEGEFIRGCTMFLTTGGTKSCLVIRIDDEFVRRHEIAHCAGWPADHPGGK